MASCAKCGEHYSDRRADLGYRTCLIHGEPRIQPPIVPVSKSNYIVGSLEELKQSYNSKGQR